MYADSIVSTYVETLGTTDASNIANFFVYCPFILIYTVYVNSA